MGLPRPQTKQWLASLRSSLKVQSPSRTGAQHTVSEVELSQQTCPYCGEPIRLLVDPSEGASEYIEDCEVCCRPMTVVMSEAPDGSVSVSVHHENE